MAFSPPDADDLRNRPEYLVARRQQRLKEFKSAVGMARIRCLTPLQVIERLRNLLNDPEESSLLYHLQECELTGEDITRLAAVVAELAKLEGLASRDRERLDRRLMRFLEMLSPESANPIAWTFLESRHRSRREVGYRILCSAGVSLVQADYLIDRFRRTGDQHLLELIVRSPEVLPKVDFRYLLESIDQPYWRARLFQGLLEHEKELALQLAEKYPFEFTHAAGRTYDRTLTERLITLAIQHSDNLEIASICAWAFGCLGAADQLSALVHAVSRASGQSGDSAT